MVRTRLIALAIVAVVAASCSGVEPPVQVTERAPVSVPEPVGDAEELDPTVPDLPDPRTTDPDTTDPDTTDPNTNDDIAEGADAPAVVLPEGPAIVDGVANGLLLVHDLDGGERALVSYQVDGTEVASYGEGTDELVALPIWSPDGRRIAWVRSSDGLAWELITAAVDGTGSTVDELPGRPDFITYDPTASRVLALTPSPDGFGLVVVELGDDAPEDTDDEPFEVIDLGAPYFSDFAPDGDRLVAHVGTDLRVVDLAGQVTSLGLTSTTHLTPVWDPTEDTLYFSAATGTGERLLAYDLASGLVTELGVVDDVVVFDLDTSGTQLAVSAFGSSSNSNGSVAAFRQTARQPVSPAADTLLDTGLWIIDLEDGTARMLDSQPATAPLWDPTGSRILVRDAFDGVGRWKVFGVDGTRTSTSEFDVDRSLAPVYLPYWDQFVRSQTVWSPDGGQFVHAGLADDGRSGVWVHDASTSGASTLLADGDLAFWSPT